MSIVVIGLNHRSVPLDILERVTVDAERRVKALHDLASRPNLSEVVVLSTCNRFEVYGVAERFHGAFGDVRNFLADLGHLAPEQFGDHLYSHYDDAAVEHLFSVAAGLDSAILGESEILGQVGEAWALSQDHQACGPALNVLFRHALEVGKRVRTETSIGRHTASVSQAAVEMAETEIGSLAGRSVLVIGAGGMGEGMVGALRRAGVTDVQVANRTRSRAEEIAARLGGRAIGLSAVPEALVAVDLVLTSTGASSTMVEVSDIEAAMVARSGRSLLIVDVAVPRDVDPAVGRLPGVLLHDLDGVRAFAERGLAERRGEIAAVRDVIELELQRYDDYVAARGAAPLVAQLHQRAESIRSGELSRFQGKLDSLTDDQREIVEHLSRSLVAKLLHDPTVRVKDAAGTLRGERLADALRHLFDLS